MLDVSSDDTVREENRLFTPASIHICEALAALTPIHEPRSLGCNESPLCGRIWELHEDGPHLLVDLRVGSQDSVFGAAQTADRRASGYRIGRTWQPRKCLADDRRRDRV